MKHAHIAVIGRIPGQDDDSCLLLRDLTVDEAKEAFAIDIYEDSGEDPEEVEEVTGHRVYISHILTSESPITEQSA